MYTRNASARVCAASSAAHWEMRLVGTTTRVCPRRVGSRPLTPLACLPLPDSSRTLLPSWTLSDASAAPVGPTPRARFASGDASPRNPPPPFARAEPGGSFRAGCLCEPAFETPIFCLVRGGFCASKSESESPARLRAASDLAVAAARDEPATAALRLGCARLSSCVLPGCHSGSAPSDSAPLSHKRSLPPSDSSSCCCGCCCSCCRHLPA
mmetsp:Transcript_29729/g.69523  ORF Transcript_29729/g.69523 Transcript_29729/m.69523 type:complete len:211 (-) Transcript_29729:808-1440(-)